MRKRVLNSINKDDESFEMLPDISQFAFFDAYIMVEVNLKG